MVLATFLVAAGQHLTVECHSWVQTFRREEMSGIVRLGNALPVGITRQLVI